MFSNYCVIFDMEGVITGTGPIHFESWVKIVKEIGTEFTRDMFEQTLNYLFSIVLVFIK